MEENRIVFSDSDNLISTSTADSKITHCNKAFCQVSGYKEEELLGQPHNIVRHKDVPRVLFAQLWSYIRSGKSWMGLVKNKCKNKGHYWVSAFITPIKDASGKIVEYQSVRSQPTDEQISRASLLYTKLVNGNVATRRIKWIDLNFWLLLIQFFLLLALALGLLQPSFFKWFLILFSLILLTTSFKLRQRIGKISDFAKSHYDNQLMEQPYTGYCDDLSTIELAMIMKISQLRAITARTYETSDSLYRAASEEVTISEAIDEQLNQQDFATNAMASSSKEMLASIDEVDNQAKQSSEFSNDAQIKAQEGSLTIDEAVDTVQVLSEQLSDSKKALVELYADVEGIEAILEMINGIAEQTNLLALNAAIEAARAGEQGRGFAVVAGEVRALSAKTGASVDEIRSKIELLQAAANKTGSLIEQGILASEVSVKKSKKSKMAFEAIVQDLTAIGKENGNISAAIAEQALVTRKMAEHVHRMQAATHSTKSLSFSSVDRINAMVVELESLERLVKQFQIQTSKTKAAGSVL